jgi:hypothetical protein
MTAEERFEKLSVVIREFKEATDNEIKELKAVIVKLSRENEELKQQTIK